jgi:hypothetical protein
VKSPLRVGAANAPKTKLRIAAAPPLSGRAKRIANLSAAVAIVVGIGASTAIFVDYLADRALARGVETPAKPVVAKVVEPAVVEPAAPAQVASLAPQPAPEPEATPLAPAPIEARLPDATEIATVAAVGPEHAIEEPTDDPTASPILHIEELGGGEEMSLDEPAPDAETAIDEGADATETAAISPDEAEPAAAEPAPKPRKAKAKAAAQPAQDTEVASLPGVDIGGMAGYASDEQDFSDSTVKTVTKPAAKAAAKGGVSAGSARVTSAVNMRSAPKKGAGVLGVVPAGTNVRVMSCDGWCQISYNGRTGWVYKSFLAAGKPQKQAEGDAPASKVQSSRL